MKISAFVTAIAILAGVAGPSLAFDRGAQTSSSVLRVSCDIKDDDKQARCMQNCDDTYIKASQAYKEGKNSAEVKKESAEDKKVCEKACGC
ncbi:MAG TPA: hypothetical protein VIE47_04395 [Methylocystis sp.]